MSVFAGFLADYFSVWMVSFLLSLVLTFLSGRWLIGEKKRSHWSARLLAFAFEAMTYLFGLAAILSFVALIWRVFWG